MLIDDIMLTWDYIPPTLHSSIQVTKSEQELGIEADWKYPAGSLIPAGDEAIQLATDNIQLVALSLPGDEAIQLATDNILPRDEAIQLATDNILLGDKAIQLATDNILPEDEAIQLATDNIQVVASSLLGTRLSS